MSIALLPLFAAFLSPADAAAALPPLGFTPAKVECQLSWTSPTAYVPEIATDRKAMNLKPTYPDSAYYEQIVVENTDAEAGPRWQGGVVVSELDGRNVFVGVFLRDPATKKTIAKVDLPVPAATKALPALVLSARVPETEERHGGERNYDTVELRCKTLR